MSDAKQAKERITSAVKDSYELVSKRIAKIWNVPEASHEDDPDYLEALKYFHEFQPKEGIDYKHAVDYMKDSAKRISDTDKLLDDKADAVIKYLGGGAAVVTAGTLLSVKTDTHGAMVTTSVLLVTLTPSLLFAVGAIWKAVSVRKPRTSTTLPSAKFAIECAEAYKDGQAEVSQWLILHPMCQAGLFRNLDKSRALEAAHIRYSLAIACLLIPVVGVSAALTGLLFWG